jgi:ABC-type transport system involved in multi-copper enzyme maturation permease subunit
MLNIALNTFREIVRNKFLYMIIFFAFIFILFSITLWALSMWNDNKIIVDFWMSMIETFWIIGVLFVWSQLLFKEIEWKTIFLILSKPIKRYEFILGKFIWFSWTIILIIVFQAILYLIMLYLKDIEITKLIIFSIFFTFLKLELLLALVFFFSSFMSNIITILVSILFYLSWHSFGLLLDLANRTKNEILIKLVELLQLLFPPYEALNIKNHIWGIAEFTNKFFLVNTVYSILYLVLILYFTVLIFKDKKFEN